MKSYFRLVLLGMFFIQSPLAMDIVTTSYQSETHSSPRINTSPRKQSQSNKISYDLVEMHFSKFFSIDYQGLYNHLGYTFDNSVFLIQALYPLLPKDLHEQKKKYKQLEFLGDAALSLVIRTKLIFIFPDKPHSHIVQCYETLTCNKALSEAYLKKLIPMEQFLPFPGDNRTCKYCDVVESLIGAIYTDQKRICNKYVENFIMRILDPQIFIKTSQKFFSQKISSPSLLSPPLTKNSIDQMPPLQTKEKRKRKKRNKKILVPQATEFTLSVPRKKQSKSTSNSSEQSTHLFKKSLEDIKEPTTETTIQVKKKRRKKKK